MRRYDGALSRHRRHVFTQVPPVCIRQFHPVTADKVVGAIRRLPDNAVAGRRSCRSCAFIVELFNRSLQGAKAGFLVYVQGGIYRSASEEARTGCDHAVPANIDRFRNYLFFRSSWNALLLAR